MSLVEKADNFAALAHEGQMRASGEAYIEHPRAVAQILHLWTQDDEALAAALLHDVVEDTVVELSEIEKEFGARVAAIVDGVTKITRLRRRFRKQDPKIDTYRKIILGMSNDLAVILVKLADRMHNMRTLGSLSPERAKRIAQETMDIYAPIAHRLGMYDCYRELEDRAFAILNADDYTRIKTILADSESERRHLLHTLGDELTELLEANNIKATVQGRVKHTYSVWLKMKRLGEVVPQDLIGLRIITEDLSDCYRVLGLIHNHYEPLPGGFSDYIANPKSNGYKSLHTKVRAHNNPLEIQIRTQEMDRDAQFGAAAHYQYKATELANSLADVTGDEFMQQLRSQLVVSEIHTLTPRGKVIVLPMGATALDFAYYVHSDLGSKAHTVLINGHVKPLGQKLVTGDTVQIITSEDAHPQSHWPGLVSTARARREITHYLSHQDQQRLIARGRQKLLSQAKDMRGLLDSPALVLAAQLMGYRRADSLYMAIGNGQVKPKTLLNKLVKYSQTPYNPGKKLIIQGSDQAGILSQISEIIHEQGGNVVAHSGYTEDTAFVLELHIYPSELDCVDLIKGIQGVFDAYWV